MITQRTNHIKIHGQVQKKSSRIEEGQWEREGRLGRKKGHHELKSISRKGGAYWNELNYYV